MVDVVLGKGSHWLWSLSKCQVAVIGLTNDKVVQLLWRRVTILNLNV